jgi:chromosome partitioning protein
MGILPTFFDARTRLSNDVLESMRERFNGLVFKSVIRVNTSLREAPSFNQTISSIHPCRAVRSITTSSPRKC